MQQVRAAQATLEAFRSDPQMLWFRENLPRARAVLISPRVTRASLGIGGAAGEAVVLAQQGQDAEWVGPAFYNLTAGSAGFQAGLDVSEILVLVMSDRALDALLRPSMKLGGEASVTAGPVSGGTALSMDADMVAFVRSRGTYAGASLKGGTIRPDNEANRAFYGKPVSPQDILVQAKVEHRAAAPLKQSLRAMARATDR
jgi:lipid-binding SYLF domain-containing protein